MTMNIRPPEPIFVLIMVFFGVVVAVGVVRAYITKEKAYYISASISGLALLATVSIFLYQFALFTVLTVAAFMVSVIGFTRLRDAFHSEAANQSREIDFSEPLKAGDFFTWIAWLKLAAKWGTNRALLIYVLFNVGVVWAFSLILSIFIGTFGLMVAIAFTPIVVVIAIGVFLRQINENLHMSDEK
jgi:hypothetical protein